MTPRRAAALLASLLVAACSSLPAGPPPDPAAPARAADDAALEEAAPSLGPMEEHYVAFAGGKYLGGAMVLEDAARLLEGAAGAREHAYLFAAGEQGARQASLPALYGSRVAGGGLLAALGVRAAIDPSAGTLALSSATGSRTFPFREGAAVAEFRVAPASGLGEPATLEFVVSTAFAGTALVSREDARGAGLHRSEVPGAATVAEALTGRPHPYRRALARVALEGPPGSPAPLASALVEVWFAR